MLPRLNGLEVLSELRRDTRLRKTPVIIVTAWTHAAEAASAAGADMFVSKPFEPDVLAHAVEELTR
jgi:chemosensory pili system protein ChpA (sensor histidine kinase/response regulator)